MNSVVLAVVAAAVADAASCNDDNVAVLTYEEVVIYALLVAGFADDYRNMAGLVLCSVLEVNIDSVAGFTGLDLDVCRGITGFARTVASDVKSADRKAVSSATSFSILFSRSSIANTFRIPISPVLLT